MPPAINVSKIKYETCVRNEDEQNVILGTAKYFFVTAIFFINFMKQYKHRCYSESANLT
jgi:hypothetical protein